MELLATRGLPVDHLSTPLAFFQSQPRVTGFLHASSRVIAVVGGRDAQKPLEAACTRARRVFGGVARVSPRCSTGDDVTKSASSSVTAPSVPTRASTNAFDQATDARGDLPAGSDGGSESQVDSANSPRGPRRTAESTDWIASAVTRRFGIGAGLAWVGFLAFGVISEQIKTRTEVFLEESNTRDVENADEVQLPGGVRYVDVRVGGGAQPQRGDLVLLGLQGRAVATAADGTRTETTIIDTSAPGARDIIVAFGVRPFPRGIANGLVLAMVTMRAGGIRKVFVPIREEVEGGGEEVGGGEEEGAGGAGAGAVGGVVLEYVVEMKRELGPPS